MMWFSTLSRLARPYFDISRSSSADLVALAKGQLISKAIYGLLNSTKNKRNALRIVS